MEIFKNITENNRQSYRLGNVVPIKGAVLDGMRYDNDAMEKEEHQVTGWWYANG